MACPAGLDRCVALFDYDGAGRALILALKYQNRRGVARPLGRAMAGLVVGPVDVVTWVPTTAKRRRERGYDQAKLLARQVARTLGVPCRGLLRRAPGAAQSMSSLADRRKGPSLSACRSGTASGPGAVLVVDDVLTTGASLAAAAVALRRAGARGVSGVTAAVTPLKVRRWGAENRSNDHSSSERGPVRMQVTEAQVQCSLAALEADEIDGTPAEAHHAHDQILPVGLIQQLTESSPIRIERLEEVRRRMETGEQPSAEDLAQRMVGRLVCDRLR